MPTSVRLRHGDPLMHRTATEYRRLMIQRDAIDQVLDGHRDILLAGLHERRTTRLDIDGIHIRRHGTPPTLTVA